VGEIPGVDEGIEAEGADDKPGDSEGAADSVPSEPPDRPGATTHALTTKTTTTAVEVIRPRRP